MKNKKAVYFLLPVVLLLWAAIFYRIFSGTGGESAVTYSGKVQEDSYLMPEKKEYELLLSYPDPFTGSSSYGVKKAVSAPQPHENTAPQEQPYQPSYDWSSVQYLGTIENLGKKNSIVLLQVQGKSYMLRKGEPQDDIQLLAFAKDSVQLKIGKEKAYIKLRNGY